MSDLIGWRKGIAAWRMGKALYLSVPFTWLLPEARRLAREHHGPVYGTDSEPRPARQRIKLSELQRGRR